MTELCDYHYYFYGDAAYPAFQCGLQQGHEGKHQDLLQIAAEKLIQQMQQRLEDRTMPDEQQKDPFAPQASELPNVSEPEVATYIRNEPQANLLASERPVHDPLARRNPYAERYTDHGEGSMIPDRVYSYDPARGAMSIANQQTQTRVSIDQQYEEAMRLVETVQKTAEELRERMDPYLTQQPPQEAGRPSHVDGSRSMTFNRFVTIEERMLDVMAILHDIHQRLEV